MGYGDVHGGGSRQGTGGASLFSTALLLAVLIGAPAVALAQAAPSPDDQAVAEFEQSEVAYREGRFEDAARLLEHAYGIAREPVLLYNLARAYESGGDYPRAIDAYERYLASDPAAEDRGGIEARIVTLRAHLPTPADPPAPAHAGPDLTLPAIPLGIGVATLIAAAIASGVALADHDRAADPSLTQVEARRAAATGYDAATAANVMWAIGGLVTAAAATWLIIAVASSPEPGSGTAATLEVSAGPGGIGVRGTF